MERWMRVQLHVSGCYRTKLIPITNRLKSSHSLSYSSISLLLLHQSPTYFEQYDHHLVTGVVVKE